MGRFSVTLTEDEKEPGTSISVVQAMLLGKYQIVRVGKIKFRITS
jgi:hypothetical protein